MKEWAQKVCVGAPKLAKFMVRPDLLDYLVLGSADVLLTLTDLEYAFHIHCIFEYEPHIFEYAQFWFHLHICQFWLEYIFIFGIFKRPYSNMVWHIQVAYSNMECHVMCHVIIWNTIWLLLTAKVCFCSSQKEYLSQRIHNLTISVKIIDKVLESSWKYKT